MGKTALITGITGQDGAYLSRFLLSKGYEVYGLLARRSTPTTWRLQYLGVLDKVHLIDGRLRHALLLEIFTDRGIGTQIVP